MEKTWNELTVAERIQVAIKNAKDIVLRNDGVNYFESTIRSRTPGNKEACGSIFTHTFLRRKSDGVEESLEHRLFEDHLKDWEEYQSCPNLASGTEAYRFRWPTRRLGRYGIIALSELPASSDIVLADPKKTGVYTPVYGGDLGIPMSVDYAVAIIGDEGGKKVMFTFHPGDPIVPSSIKKDDILRSGAEFSGDGFIITVHKAKTELGLKYAKFAPHDQIGGRE